MSLSNTTNLQVFLPHEQINKHAFIAAGVLLAIIGFFGFFLNLLVIVVILKDATNMWTPVNVVLLNLVMLNKISSCIFIILIERCLRMALFGEEDVDLGTVRSIEDLQSMIILKDCGVEEILVDKCERNSLKWFRHVDRMKDERLTKQVYQGNVNGSVPRGTPRKDGYAWLMSTLGMASIGNLTVMAVERWMLITRPMKALTIRKACVLVSCVWIYALSLSLPPLLGWGSYGQEAGNISCSVSWEKQDPITHSASYIAYLFAFGLLIPLIFIGSSYGSIVITLRTMRRRVGSRRRQEERVTKMVALMIAAFLIAWTPYAIVSLGAQYFNMKLSPEVSMMPAILAKSSICYNPIIYAGLNTQFLKSVKSVFRIRGKSRAENTRPESTRRAESITELTVSKRQNELIIHEELCEKEI
ncbi:rhodopsin-like [Belonocnema kinseyi]|uniref:rhodopsin-like n=1 Tax=Belonocnema kinseyi TaxID=2817044 RepID=UPI00143DEB55|nr:rhodopsin-like [Belonocnema kinseyi]